MSVVSRPSLEQIFTGMRKAMGGVPSAVEKLSRVDPEMVYEHLRSRAYAMPDQSPALDDQTRTLRNQAKITSHFPAGPFGLQLRCSLVSDPLPGYAPHSRLASGQNFCAVKHEFIFARSLIPQPLPCMYPKDDRQTIPPWVSLLSAPSI